MNVIFVAPYFGANMIRCLGLLAGMNLRLGVLSSQAADSLPGPLRKALAGHYQIDDCLDPQQLANGVRAFQKEWGQVDRLIGYLEQLQLPLAQARQAAGIPGMLPQAARNFRDKNRMKEVLRAAGLPVARQTRVSGAADALRFVKDVGFPVVVKPLDGMGSKGTLRCSNLEDLYRALNRLTPSPARPVQCEEFVVGEEHTFETVCIDGKPVWRSSTYYLPGPLKVLETPWMQYCVLLPREQARPHVRDFYDLNTRALQALGMGTGISHMEWFLRADGRPVISEVGARPPGVNIMAIMGIAHNMDLWQKWLELEVFQRFAAPPRSCAAGSAFLRAQGGGRIVRSVTGIETVSQKLGDKLVSALWPRVGQARADSYEGEGWVLVRADSTEEAVAALRTVITGVKVRA